MCTRTQEKGTVIPQKTVPDFPVGVWESPEKGVGQWWPAAGLGAWTVAVYAWDLLREVNIIFIIFTIVLPQVNSREGNSSTH